jgi:Lipopolysaccharide kinase (Kdo/WaaP) family
VNPRAAHLALDTALGRLDIVAPQAELARLAIEPALAALLGAPRTAQPVDLGGRAAWIKASHLSGSAAWRYGLRRRLLLRAPPRVRELENLDWLLERLFRAPQPLAAGSITRGMRMRFQFLLMARLDDVRPLDAALEVAPAAERAELLDELAREVARMHALRFVHRDLYLRNVLVRPPFVGPGDPRRLAFVDAWRGGPFHPWRGPAFDLGCLMLDGAGLLDAREQRTFVRLYLSERAVQGRPADASALLAAAARARKSQLERVRREPHRWRRAEPPAPEWDPRALSD